LRRSTLHFNQAHTAVSGDGKPFVETETRDFRARGFGSLKERIVIGYFDLCAVNLDLCHRLSKPAAQAASSRSQTLALPLFGMAFSENRQALFGAMPCRAGSHNLFSRFQTDIAALNGVAGIIVKIGRAHV